MNLLPICIATLYGLVLAALGLAIFAIVKGHVLARTTAEAAETAAARENDNLKSLAERLEACERQVQELLQLPAAGGVAPRNGLNLSKRSQALRMHRRGDDPEQIAVALEVPLQEVDLLLKVHQIVLEQV
jgi:hypothetical protein